MRVAVDGATRTGWTCPARASLDRGARATLLDGADARRGARRRPRRRDGHLLRLERPTLADLFREAVAA